MGLASGWCRMMFQVVVRCYGNILQLSTLIENWVLEDACHAFHFGKAYIIGKGYVSFRVDSS